MQTNANNWFRNTISHAVCLITNWPSRRVSNQIIRMRYSQSFFHTQAQSSTQLHPLLSRMPTECGDASSDYFLNLGFRFSFYLGLINWSNLTVSTVHVLEYLAHLPYEIYYNFYCKWFNSSAGLSVV